MIEQPWLAVEDVCVNFGVSYATAKNKIGTGTFPVPTYKVGKRHVIDKTVYEEFFRRQREAGLRALETTTG